MIGPPMLGLIDWVLDKIAPIGLTNGARTECDEYWQSHIVDKLSDEHNRHVQMLSLRVSGEEKFDG